MQVTKALDTVKRLFILNYSEQQDDVQKVMEITLAQKAISLALSGNWKEAIEINLLILKENPEDTEALNRLAKAYSENGQMAKAKETAHKVIKLDPINPIAKKCLDRWNSMDGETNHGDSHVVSSDSFLEEPGKTRLIQLVNTGDIKLFASLDPGEEVKLSSYSHKVSIMTKDGKYLGRLPDDVAARIRGLIKAGVKYQVLIKSIQAKDVTVFIRETFRSDEAPDMLSFPTEKIEYVTFTPPELVHKEQPEIGGEEETQEE